MKKAALIIILFITLLFSPPLFYKEGAGGSSAHADMLAMAAPMPVSIHTIMGGIIKTVSWANPTKGTKSEILVKDGAKNVHILVMSTTTLWDADAKAILPDKILPKKKVNVIYLTTDEGVNIGKSIKILK